MTAAKEDFSKDVDVEVVTNEEHMEEKKSMSTKIGEYIGRHILGFTFLGGVVVGSSYTKAKMTRQFKATTKGWEKMLSSATGMDIKLF